MKYSDYIKSLEQLPHKTTDGRSIAQIYADAVEIWSNYACIGYARIAMQAAGLDKQSIDKVIKEMHHAFDDYSVDEAEKHY